MILIGLDSISKLRGSRRRTASPLRLDGVKQTATSTQQENGDDVNLSRANEDYASNQNADGIDR